MYVLIAVIFIAELIIAGFVLYWIVKADKAVKALDIKFAYQSPAIIEEIKTARSGIQVIKTAITKTVEFIQRKRLEFWHRIVNLIVIYIILFFLKTKFKKAATFCQYAVFIKDCWDSIPA